MEKFVLLCLALACPQFLNAARLSAVRGTGQTPIGEIHDSLDNIVNAADSHPSGLIESEAKVVLDLYAIKPQLQLLAQVVSEENPSMESHYASNLKRSLAIGALVVCSLTAMAAGIHWLHHLQSTVLSLLVCAVYVAFCVVIEMSIAVQRETAKQAVRPAAFSFDPACAVMLAEALKLSISIVLYLRSVYQPNSEKEEAPSSIMESLRDSGISFTDAKWLGLSGILFTTNHLLVYKAIGGNDMAAFGIFRDTVIIFTAGLWFFVFRTPLGPMRLAGISVIFAGLILNRASLLVAGAAWSWAFFWVVLMSMSNSLGSVSSEFAMKRSQGIDINLQNTFLYAAGVVCAALVVLVTDTQRFLSPTTFFNGFTQRTLFTVMVQVVAGLLVSRILKYADAVTKTVASCLRGPLVVLISPLFVTSPQDIFTIVSALVVATGCFTYMSAGKLEVANPNAAQAHAHTNLAKMDANKMDAS